MLEVPKAPIRLKDVDPLESESVLMLNKDTNKSLLSEKYRAELGKMVCLAAFIIANSLKYNFFCLCKKTLVNQWNFNFLRTVKTPYVDTVN